MKKLLKKIIRMMVSNPFIWRILDKVFLPPARYMDWMHHQSKSSLTTERDCAGIINAEAIKHLNSTIILHGPFKGMAYENDLFCCSAIPPKLLGSYEQEIHPWLERINEKTYDGVIDVGCAEGYYAVGFAWKFKNTPVYAYDINENARSQCQKLAIVNRVQDKIDIRTYCDPDELKRVVDGKRFLIISDCEGYEKTLFNASNMSSLRNSDILIEVHDFMDVTILPYLRALFAITHHIEEVHSLDDLRKLDLYDYPEIRTLEIHKKYNVIAEWRQRIMVWMYLTPLK